MDDSDIYSEQPLLWDETNLPRRDSRGGEELPDEDAPARQGVGAERRWDVVPAAEAPKPGTMDFPAGGDWHENAASAQGPERIVWLRRQCIRMPWEITRDKAFYDQAQTMADFNDDYDEIVPFTDYYPTYQSMNIAQLRSYFTIRHELRRGKFPVVPMSYLFVYAYEALMHIGASSVEEGLDTLRELADNYSADNPVLARYLKAWTCDYVVYNNLTSHIDEYFSREIAQDRDFVVVSDYAHADDAALWEVVSRKSKYNIAGASLCRKRPDDVREVALRVVRRAAPVLERQLKRKFERICLGFYSASTYYSMYQGAVFYDPKPPVNFRFIISPRRRFTCRDGLWRRFGYVKYGMEKSFYLGILMREVDVELREALDFKPRLQGKKIDDELRALVAGEVRGYMRELAEAARPKVEIDASRFGAIRSDADVVRRALLTDEERAEEAAAPAAGTSPSPAPEPQPATEVSQPAAADAADDSGAPFTADERGFLSLLMGGGDWRAFLRSRHIPQGVMAENVNNKALDILGDIILDDDGAGLTLIDDYREDVIKSLKG